MSRIARIVVPGLPHHITQKGNYGQNVFIDDSCREVYLSLLKKYILEYEVTVLSYCLMTNHVHLIAIPKKEDSFAKTFRVLNTMYSHYVNEKKDIKGHLWQERFYSSVLDEKHLIVAARYVERNPVRARIVSKPYKWKWSSAEEHTGKGKSPIPLGDLLGIINYTTKTWKSFIEDFEDDTELRKIRENTKKGYPSGEESFVKELEKNLGLKFSQGQKGRPKKGTY